MRCLFDSIAIDEQAIIMLFNEVDVDSSGYINKSELKDMLIALHLHYRSFVSSLLSLGLIYFNPHLALAATKNFVACLI